MGLFDYAGQLFTARPLEYASSQVRRSRERRVRFHLSDKELPVSLNMNSRYFKVLSPDNKMTVTHNRRFNPSNETFAHAFNDSTDFYGASTRANAAGVVKTMHDLTHNYGHSPVPRLRDGPFEIDIADGRHNNRLSRPIHIFELQKLDTFISLGGT